MRERKENNHNDIADDPLSNYFIIRYINQRVYLTYHSPWDNILAKRRNTETPTIVSLPSFKMRRLINAVSFFYAGRNSSSTIGDSHVTVLLASSLHSY